MRMLDCRARRSVPGDNRLVPAEVQADFDQMDVLPDFNVHGFAVEIYHLRKCERVRPRAEVHVVVLQLPGDAVGEGELDAGAKHPAPSPVLVLDGDGRSSTSAFATEKGAIDPVPLVGPCQTALHVQHGAIDGAAEPHREASERVNIGFAGVILSGKETASVAAANAGPARLGFDAHTHGPLW